MNPLRVLGGLAVALVLACLPACNRGSSGPKVAFVTNNPETFWNIAEKGCRKAEKEFGVEVIFRMPSPGEVSRQTQIVEDLVNQDVKAIAVSVINPKGQRDLLQEVSKKVALFTQDNDAPDSGRLCYIGTNNYKAGRTLGKLVKEALPGGGELAIFVGQTDALNARQRHEGLLDELAGNPEPKDVNNLPLSPDGKTYGKYHLHRTYTDQPIGSQKATENAGDALTDLKDAAAAGKLVMVGLWAYNPPAILTAVSDFEKGKLLGKVKIVAFDENTATLKGIADGHIYATVVQDPYKFGYESVRLMSAYAKGDKGALPKDGNIFIPERIITKDGGKGRIEVAKFEAQLKELLAK